MDSPHARLLLLPGLEGSGDLFDPLIEEFAGGLDPTVARYPFSCTSYNDLTPIVSRLLPGSRPFILVAESFSTPLAIEIAGSAQGEIDGLVLCNGFAVSPLAAWESTLASASAPWLFRFPLTSLAARTLLVGHNASQGLVDAVRNVIGTLPPDILCARLNAVLRCDMRAALARIRVPVLYLHATRDKLIGDVGLNEMRRVKPDMTVQHIDGPHLLLQREPKQCAESIARFIAAIASEAATARRRNDVKPPFPQQPPTPTPTEN
ncbi:MAG TPA: alpha/beta hydrolase [Terracidiphilus sp.]|jgi:pimeloyl-ACP methyl ester carboxylesterase